jgi:hypothetical protein
MEYIVLYHKTINDRIMKKIYIFFIMSSVLYTVKAQDMILPENYIKTNIQDHKLNTSEEIHFFRFPRFV